jgi:hypothetical protein
MSVLKNPECNAHEKLTAMIGLQNPLNVLMRCYEDVQMDMQNKLNGAESRQNRTSVDQLQVDKLDVGKNVIGQVVNFVTSNRFNLAGGSNESSHLGLPGLLAYHAMSRVPSRLDEIAARIVAIMK